MVFSDKSVMKPFFIGFALGAGLLLLIFVFSQCVWIDVVKQTEKKITEATNQLWKEWNQKTKIIKTTKTFITTNYHHNNEKTFIEITSNILSIEAPVITEKNNAKIEIYGYYPLQINLKGGFRIYNDLWVFGFVGFTTNDWMVGVGIEYWW